jgi:hypothetical protein
MTSTISSDTLAGLAGEFAALVDRLQQVDLVRPGDDEVVEFWQAVEVQTRRLAALDHRLIVAVEQRGLPGSRACANTAALLRQVLTVAPAQAKGRVSAAGVLGPRQFPGGPVLPPEFPDTAAALTQGAISARHAAVITRTVAKLPVDVRDELGDWVETHLLEHARVVDPVLLARHAQDLANALDQDGQYRELGYRDRTRDARFTRRPDGSGQLAVDFTAEAAEAYAVFFDALAAPQPAAEGEQDPRTPGQRRHDALLELVTMAMRTGQLPHAGGMTATIVVTMDAEAFATGIGTALTGHGYTIPADVAKRWAGDDARIIAALLDRTGRIEAYSSTQRCFSEQQRLVLSARDRGCTFPGCDRPPGWCQAHHVTEYRNGGPTSIDNGALLCGYHHRTFETAGWSIAMLDGQAWWTPPTWIDPDQQPIRNTMHDRCTV